MAEGAHAVVILDGAGYHGAGHLELPANLTLVRLPPYAPELNSAENIWEYLRKNKLANSIFETYDEIVEACSNAWNFFATDPPPSPQSQAETGQRSVFRAVGIRYRSPFRKEHNRPIGLRPPWLRCPATI